ncbi:MAG: molybdopterin-synthase adenylyltransferase MoeB [Brevibacterium yomogidense]
MNATVQSSALPPLVEPGPELTVEEIERYSRHLTLEQVGETGQRRLKNARVLVIGAGGLGAPVLHYLAAAGVGTIGIVDDDRVSVSNLQRQVLHGVEDVGDLKTESAARALARLNPLVTVQQHPVRLNAQNARDIVAGYDLVLDGADNFGTRYLVSDACALEEVPCVWGSILRFEGRVSVFWSGRGPTYRDLHPEPPPAGEVPSCAEGGVLGMLPGTIGSVMAAEAVKLLTGIGEPLVGRLLLHDALAMTWRELRVVADPATPSVTRVSDGTLDADGPGACERAPGAPGEPGAEAETTSAARDDAVTAGELAAMLDRRAAGRAEFALIDVREDWERRLVSIPGAVPVALDALLDHGIEALPAEARGVPVVLHCKSGGRSARALARLQPNFAYREETVRHLDGGVLAWVRDVAPHLPEY